jgi:hypothetical protein
MHTTKNHLAAPAGTVAGSTAPSDGRATIPPPTPVTIYAHEVRRLTIAVGAGFDDFRDRYEQSVPSNDDEHLAAMVRAGVDWDTILRTTAEHAPHHFLRYRSSDVGSLMQLAGDSPRCISYLMGNHTIAERMYRHNPTVMLYAPLRTAIHEDANGTTWFSVDQPSTQFASFGDPAITNVGLELDHKLAALLEHLSVPVPPALTA